MSTFFILPQILCIMVAARIRNALIALEGPVSNMELGQVQVSEPVQPTPNVPAYPYPTYAPYGMPYMEPNGPQVWVVLHVVNSAPLCLYQRCVTMPVVVFICYVGIPSSIYVWLPRWTTSSWSAYARSLPNLHVPTRSRATRRALHRSSRVL